jgi:hypothetical protein
MEKGVKTLKNCEVEIEKNTQKHQNENNIDFDLWTIFILE